MQKGPWRITFDTNPHDCNLRCIMCEVHSPFSDVLTKRRAAKKPKPRMDFTLVESTIKQAKKLGLKEIIPSTMGEPLVYKHFTHIIELCQKYDLKLNLTTNGTFPQKGAAAWARLIVPVGSDIKISWNGAKASTQERIMLGTHFEKMLANLKAFIKIRDEYAKSSKHYCNITLQLTFIQENVEEMIDIVNLGIDLGINRIKGHHLWAHFNEIKSQSLIKEPTSIKRWNTIVKASKKLAETKLLASGKQIKLENFHLIHQNQQNTSIIKGECPFLGKEAWVDTDGRFNPCCAPDKLRKTLGDFGNLTEKSLEEIWHSESYRNLCKNYKTYAVCNQCNMRR